MALFRGLPGLFIGDMVKPAMSHLGWVRGALYLPWDFAASPFSVWHHLPDL